MNSPFHSPEQLARLSVSMKAFYAAKRAPLIEQMRALVAETPSLSAVDLAQRMGIAYSSVRLYAKEAGLTLAHGPKGPRPGSMVNRAPPTAEARKNRGAAIAARAAQKREAVLAQLRVLLEANPRLNNGELAEKLGVSRHQVSRCLLDAGIRTRRELADVDGAVEAYRSGKTRREVTKMFCISPGRLMAAVKAAGIEARGPTGRPPGSGTKRVTERRPRMLVPGAPVDQQRHNLGKVNGALRIVRVADGVVLAATNSPEKALQLCAFFGPMAELRRAA